MSPAPGLQDEFTDQAAIPKQKLNRPSGEECGLPSRDWILLPLLALLTVILTWMAMDCLARQVFSRSSFSVSIYRCVLGSSLDVLMGLHGSPNTVCTGSDRDTPSTEYRLNRCGHRTPMDCGPKPPGVFRIVTLGSSLAIGEAVPVERSVASLLPLDLKTRTNRKIELYNEGMFGEWPDTVAEYFDQVRPEQPDLVLWIVTPHDLTETTVPASSSDLLQPKSRWSGLLNLAGKSPAAVALESYLYRNPNRYLRSYLQTGADAGFLRSDYDAAWQFYMRQFMFDVAVAQTKARTAGVPLVVVLVPNRAQAAMVSMGYAVVGFDPYKLERDLRSSVEASGDIFLDILPDFRDLPDADRYYFPVNGHPTEEGCARIAGMIARQLTSGAVPGLRASSNDRGRGN